MPMHSRIPYVAICLSVLLFRTSCATEGPRCSTLPAPCSGATHSSRAGDPFCAAVKCVQNEAACCDSTEPLGYGRPLTFLPAYHFAEDCIDDPSWSRNWQSEEAARDMFELSALSAGLADCRWVAKDPSRCNLLTRSFWRHPGEELQDFQKRSENRIEAEPSLESVKVENFCPETCGLCQHDADDDDHDHLKCASGSVGLLKHECEAAVASLSKGQWVAGAPAPFSKQGRSSGRICPEQQSLRVLQSADHPEGCYAVQDDMGTWIAVYNSDVGADYHHTEFASGAVDDHDHDHGSSLHGASRSHSDSTAACNDIMINLDLDDYQVMDRGGSECESTAYNNGNDAAQEKYKQLSYQGTCPNRWPFYGDSRYLPTSRRRIDELQQCDAVSYDVRIPNNATRVHVYVQWAKPRFCSADEYVTEAHECKSCELGKQNPSGIQDVRGEKTACMCTDEPSDFMKQQNVDCSTWEHIKCNKDPLWTELRTCQKTCHDVGMGYPGDVCDFGSAVELQLIGVIEGLGDAAVGGALATMNPATDITASPKGSDAYNKALVSFAL